MGILGNLGRVSCGNPAVTLALCPGVVDSHPPLPQGPMSLKRALRGQMPPTLPLLCQTTDNCMSDLKYIFVYQSISFKS